MKKLPIINRKYDVTVVGGGLAGLCAAIASARNGAKTALIHNRAVLGGNASSEIHVPYSGASRIGQRKNAREGGIIDEIFLENRHVNVDDSSVIFDMILWGKAEYQENLDLFLNTTMTDVKMKNDVIESISAIGIMNETKYNFASKIFIDCTGDGTMAYLAGADYLRGREGSRDFSEDGAVSEQDNMTMGNSLLMQWEDTGHPVKFVKPDWAYDYKNKDLGNLTADNMGFWWIELGGTKLDIIKNFNEIEIELKKIIMGVWDYIKNSGKFEADNYDLKWVSTVGGKRESRRFCGDYILNENDLLNSKRFDDAVAYGGWHIDSHQPEKFYNWMRQLDGLPDTEKADKSSVIENIYQIPYRCLYSRNIKNLLFAGRNISVTHRALASTRVMGTCAITGQAAGTAAAFSAKHSISPKETGELFIKELQQQLIKDDCYIPFLKNEDRKDYARNAVVSCSSYTDGNEGKNIVNGISRTEKEESNYWESENIIENEWIRLDFKKTIAVKEIRIYFDANYSLEIYPVQAKWHREKVIYDKTPDTLVKKFSIAYLKNKNEVFRKNIEDNYQRMFTDILDSKICCDEILIEVYDTYGYKKARIFEVRVY